MAKILLVDDDVELVELLVEVFQLEGFQVDSVTDGYQALNKLDAESYDLVLLDIMMPVLNGIETLKRIRKKYTVPVIMLTARGEDVDRVLGLELGADDYLAKPFNDRELIARIKALLRRVQLLSTNANLRTRPLLDEQQSFEFCNLVLYPGRQQVICDNKNLELTGTEFALLQILIENPGQVLSRDFLSRKILDKPLTPFDRSIDMHMSNLRKKLPPRADDSPWFKTLRGRGYLLVSEK